MKHLPNIITLSRLVFMGVIAYLSFHTWPGAATLVFLLCLAASVSDWLDGYIARKYGFVTNFGKLMDAIADKFMVVGLFLVLIMSGLLDGGMGWLRMLAWAILIATVLRDLVITGIRMIAARKGVVLAADNIGKRKTIWQSTSICVLFFVPVVWRDLAFLDLPAWFGEWIWLNGVLYYLLGGFLAMFSGVVYVIRYAPHLRPGAGRQA
jgi:CDP-diacylglycerol--glycerol-3-phosphate 3-phosphatidyltransferase